MGLEPRMDWDAGTNGFLWRWDAEIDSAPWAGVVRNAAAPLPIAAAAVIDIETGELSVSGDRTRIAALRDWAMTLPLNQVAWTRTSLGFAAALRSPRCPSACCVADFAGATGPIDDAWCDRLQAAMVLATAYVTTEGERLEQQVRVRQLLAEQRVLAGMHNDIVAENLNERELSAKDKQRLVAELENQLEARTLELRTTLARVQDASLAKSKFLANMSHELRTPMTSILGYAELLMTGDLTGEGATRAIETIYRNGDHLLSLLNDVLDLSRIESGRFPIEKLVVNPVTVAVEVIELIRTRARIRGLSVGFELLGPIPERIETDPTRWRQILVNLLGNAVKFTREGSISLALEFERTEASRGKLICLVRDSGIGMSREQLERIFEPFTQAEPDIARRFGGTGLGLSISRRLAQILGGEISVDSAPDQGSTFRATISVGVGEDVAMVQTVPQQEPNHSAPTVSAPSALLRGRVLLAEDGPDNQRLINTMLQRAGLSVTLVADGRLAVEEALAAMRQNVPFGVILMDVQMPEMDGMEATRVLRKHGYKGAIVALTANAMVGDRDACLSAGCDDYIAKPINRAVLLATLGRFIPSAAPADATDGSAFSALASPQPLAGEINLSQ